MALAMAGIALAGAARANTVTARWIQLGPGSTAAALTKGAYGDDPASLTPTILARAIVDDLSAGASACPPLVVDGSLKIPMSVRFTGGQVTNTPSSTLAGQSGNGPNAVATTAGYPQYFVSADATAPAAFASGVKKVTVHWGVCEAVVPAGHTTAVLGGVPLKLPAANPRRLLVLGDTGCRLANGNYQNCVSTTDAKPFLFPTMANDEAGFDADLVIHTGDIFYRDTSCRRPDGTEAFPGCDTESSPNYLTWGDTFDSWNADFFAPAVKLLAAAPWVITRGNHESCGRGARGWFALLDPHPFDLANVTCANKTGAAPVTGTTPVYSADFQPAYVVPVGPVNLLVHDSSYANDSAIDVNMAKNDDLDMTALLNRMPKGTYNAIVTHKPLFGLTHKPGPTNSGNYTEQFAYSGNATPGSAFRGGVPPGVAFFLSGHIHSFQYVNFQDNAHYAPQIVVGTGGDNLDKAITPGVPVYTLENQAFTVHDSLTSTTMAQVTNASARWKFGFAVLDRTVEGFTVTIYDNGPIKAGTCGLTLAPRRIVCDR